MTHTLDPHRRERRIRIALLGLPALAALLLLGYQLQTSYNENIRTAEITTRNYAAIFEARLNSTLRRVDADLQSLQPLFPDAALQQQAVPRLARRYDAALDAHLGNFPDLTALRVFDAGGELLYSSSSATTPRINISDRSHFGRLRDDPQAGLVFSEVIISRVSNQHSVIAARALRDAQGGFRGIVAAVIGLEHFQKLFQSLDLGAHGVAAIRRSDDFTQVARWPPLDSQTNKTLPPNVPVRRAISAGARTGTTGLTGRVDGVVRILSFHRLERYPFLVLAAMAYDDVLAGWRARALAVGLSGLLLLGLLGVMLLRLWRAEARREHTEETLRKLNQSLEARVEERTRALEASKERLRRGQFFANIGSWEWNIQTGELFWSERIAPLFGHKEGELETSYDNFLAAIHPEDRQAVIDAVNACVERDAPYDIEHRVVWPDGTVRWLLERGAVVRDAAGAPLQMLGVVQDITERKAAEIRLRESEQRFAFAVEGAGDGIWDWDLRTNAMQFSRLYMEMLGYAEHELPQHADTWSNSVHPDDAASVQPKLQAYMEGRSAVYAIELRLRCKNGSYKWILCRGTVVQRDSAGKPVRMIGIHVDIDQRKRTEQALIEAREEADRANQAKSEFLSSMSHELRTPMNSILGFGQLIEFDDTLPAEHKGHVSEILKAGHHLLELIDEVLDLSKIESGSVVLSLEPVQVGSVVDECLALASILAEQRSVRISHAGLEQAVVRADRTRLKQALLNLLSNAIKYNRTGGSVDVEVQAAGAERLRIRVSDTGPGIAPERLTELFQPFNRLGAEASDIEGTGIGLTITRRIVELMGGSVEVESTPGAGSSFWIELPLDILPTPAPAGAATAPAGVAPAPRVGPARHTVLYIEDNPSNLKLMAQILSKRSHIHLLTAHTPALGIELARARHPDLILLDISMPGMDGYEVLQVFKADARLQAVPVVAVSANAMPRDIERGKQAGFSDYLTKPLDVARLHAAMDRLLGAGSADGARP